MRKEHQKENMIAIIVCFRYYAPECFPAAPHCMQQFPHFPFSIVRIFTAFGIINVLFPGWGILFLCVCVRVIPTSAGKHIRPGIVS